VILGINILNMNYMNKIILYTDSQLKYRHVIKKI
jgi:hypothetical protein